MPMFYLTTVNSLLVSKILKFSSQIDLQLTSSAQLVKIVQQMTSSSEVKIIVSRHFLVR